jgi:hypothetical protein
VTDEHIRQALEAARSFSDPSPREKSLALLQRMVEVARPNAGAPRMLVLLARMARRDWLDGDLVVRLIGDSELAVLELFVDDGASRERIAGPLRIDVPMDEFVAALDRDRSQLVPLVAVERSSRRLELRGTRDLRALQRKGSISAFAAELGQGLGGDKPAAPPQPQKPASSYAKLPAVLEMPDDDSATAPRDRKHNAKLPAVLEMPDDDSATSSRDRKQPPPLPPKRSRRARGPGRNNGTDRVAAGRNPPQQ